VVNLHPVSVLIITFKAIACIATIAALGRGMRECNPVYEVVGLAPFMVLVWVVTVLSVIACELGHRRSGLYVLLRPYAYSMLVGAILDAVHDVLALAGVEVLRPLLTDYLPLTALASYSAALAYVVLCDPEVKEFIHAQLRRH